MWLPLIIVGGAGLWWLTSKRSPTGASYDNVPPPPPAVYVPAFNNVLRRFYEVEGVLYSWGGGHPPSADNWPQGTVRAPATEPGLDCTGLILTLLAALGLVLPDLGAGGLFTYVKSLGQLRDPRTARPGDVMLFARRDGKVVHAAMVLIPKGGFPSLEGLLRADMRARAKEGVLYSAFRGGRNTHADDPRAKVMWHTQDGTGLAPAGVWTPPWRKAA